MKWLRTRLVNAGLHADSEFDFSPGLVGVFGPNGCGKSTAISLGGYAALTGDWARLAESRDKLVRQLCDESAKSYVESTFSHGETQFTITRNLRTGAARLESTDGTTYTKVSAINEWLATAVGVTPEILDAYVFVDQGRMFDFISAQPAERAKAFAYLCQTERAERIWRAVSSQLTSDQILTFRDEEREVELTTRVASQKEEAARYAAAILTAREQLLTADELSRHETTVAGYSRFLSLQEQWQAAKDKLAASEGELGQLTTDLQPLVVELAAADADLAKLNELRDSLETQAKVKQQAVDVCEKLAACRSTIGVAESKLAKLRGSPAMQTSTEELTDKLATLLSIEKRTQERLQLASLGGSCPTCGSMLSTDDIDPDEARNSLAKIADELTHLRCTEAERKRTEAEIRLYEHQLEVERTKAEEFTETLRPLLVMLDSVDDAVLDKMAVVKRDIAAMEGFIRRQSPIAEGYGRQQSRLEGSIDTLRSTCERIEADVKTLPNKDQAGKAAVLITAHQTAERQVQDNEIRRTLALRNLAEAEAELSKVAESNAKAVKAEQWVGRLTSLKTAFHRDNLPRKIAYGYLTSLLGDLNRILEEFDSPFLVECDESLTFNARFADGRNLPARQLSGGQKVVLAIAFRWAVYATFASDVGLLVLDEPTAFLDARHLDCLERCLKRISEIASDRGMQVILVTHADKLRRVFDQVIELGVPDFAR